MRFAQNQTAAQRMSDNKLSGPCSISADRKVVLAVMLRLRRYHTAEQQLDGASRSNLAPRELPLAS